MDWHLEKCVVRPWKTTDIPTLAKYANNENIASNLRDIFPYPYTASDADYFINRIANCSENQIILAIEVNGEAAGSIGVHFKTDIYKKNAEIGYWLAEQYWGMGILTEVLSKMVRYVFENYDVVRIYAEVFENNIASVRVLEKCGFKREATLSKAVFKNNQFLDEYIYSCISIC